MANELSKLQVNGTVYTLKDTEARKVAANTEASATESLTKLTVGDITYSIPEQGAEVTQSENNGYVKVGDEDVQVYLLPQDYKDYLDEVTYKKPSVQQLQILNAEGNSVAGTYECGSSVVISSFKHYESNVSNINGNLSLTISSGTMDVSPSATAKSELLSETITESTIYRLSGTDTRGNFFDKSASITFNRYAYSKLTTNDTAPTESLTKQAEQGSFKTNGADFTYTAGQYLYIYLTESGKQAQTNVLGQWTDVSSSVSSGIEITQANGATYTYYAYKIGPFIANGTAKYRVK